MIEILYKIPVVNENGSREKEAVNLTIEDDQVESFRRDKLREYKDKNSQVTGVDLVYKELKK